MCESIHRIYTAQILHTYANTGTEFVNAGFDLTDLVNLEKSGIKIVAKESQGIFFFVLKAWENVDCR